MSVTQLSLPNTREPFLDASGNISRSWWRFLNDLFRRVGGSNSDDLTSVIALLTGTAATLGDELVSSAMSGQVATLAELGKRLEAVESAIHPAQSAELVKAIGDMRAEIAMLPDCSAQLAESRKLSAFSAYSTAGQAFASGSFLPIAFQAKLFDDLGEFNTTNSTFAPNQPGTYCFNLALHGTQAASAVRILALYVNGTIRLRAAQNGTDPGTNMLAGSTGPVRLAAGDVLQAHYFSSIADTTIAPKEVTYFSGYRIK